MMRNRALPLVLVLALAAVAPLAAQEEPPAATPETATTPEAPTGTFTETLQVVAVDVVVEVHDAEGNTPADLSAADFSVLVDGVERPVVSALRAAGATPAPAPEPLPTPAATPTEEVPAVASADLTLPESDLPPWTTVIYFDQPLLAVPAVDRAARNLAAAAPALTHLGSVEIVVANPLPQTLLPATRDAEAVAAALGALAAGSHGGQELLTLRRRFLDELNTDQMSDLLSKSNEASGPRRDQPRTGRPDSATILDRTTERREDPFRDTTRRLSRQRMLVRNYARIEEQLLDRQRTFLLDWLAGYGGGKPRALLLVNDGFDEDPRDFYLHGIDSQRLEAELRGELEKVSSGPDTEELNRILAAHGWTVMPVALGGLAATDVADAATAGRERYRAFAQDRYAVSSGRGFTASTSPSSLLVAPLSPLLDLADATGGRLVVDERKLPAAIAGLGDRYLVTYQVPGPADGSVHRIEVRSLRPGLTVEAPRFVAAATPESIAALRARRLLEGSVRHGDLPLSLAVEHQGQGGDNVPVTLKAVADLGPLAPVREGLGATSLRATVAVLLPNGQVFIHHQTALRQNLTQLAEWRYNATLNLPAGSTEAALVIEELATGAWGGSATSVAPGAATNGGEPR